MNKKLIITGIISFIILGGIVFLALKKSEKALQGKSNISGMIFFYGEQCPHCKNVEKFLEENKNIEEKVKFEKLEVWKNKESQALLVEKAKKCEIDINQLGVPLFWDGSGCTVGDVDIIDLLKKKAEEQ